MLISIIMPVYKTAPFIAEAIESVLRQTYPQWELIIVDDGSPDNAPVIAHTYAQKDKRIKVIHQTNQGVSVARNTGITHCQGEYLGFLDSDDYYFPNFLQAMVDKIKSTHCDSVYCGYIDQKNNSTIYGPPYAEGNILECYALHKQHIWINCFVVKRTLLQKYNICFSAGRKIGEDQEFIFKCGLYITTNSVKKALVFYRYNKNSVMNQLNGSTLNSDIETKKIIKSFVNKFCSSPHKTQILDFIQHTIEANLYNYQRVVWKAITKDKKFDEALQDLKDFGKLNMPYKKNKFQNTIKAFIINTHNKTLWKLVSVLKKRT